jgi:hypothetical protein
MPALARGQENNQSILNWFITINGVLTDAYQVEYRIFDITTGLPGVQVFPSTSGTYENATNSPAKFSTGSYYAYDRTALRGYTPSVVASVGTHRIEWRWKISAAAPFQAGQEDFEVIVQSAGGSVDTYVSIADVRAEGLTNETDFPDEKILSYIETWQAFLERACRQWFVPKSLILEIDGTDSDTIHFGVPIISIDWIKINNSYCELSKLLYKVYDDKIMNIDRQNPRIKLVNTTDRSDIFTAPLDGRALIFRKGRKNQIVKGLFGYVESDGSVPKLIKRALLKLVVEKLAKPMTGYSSVFVPPILGSIASETTDEHSITYLQATKRPVGNGLSGITTDQEILTIIKMYRAPIGVATPANPSYR